MQSSRISIAKKYQGTVDYKKLVKLYKQLKFNMNDIQRKMSFKIESIERAIFCEDTIISMQKGDRILRSIYMKKRDTSKTH